MKRGPRPKTAAELEKKENARRMAAIDTPLTMREKERFRTKVMRLGIDECWPWQGARTGKGYGQMTIRSRHTGDFRATYAHRLALWIDSGKRPRRLVLHSCDNPPCCNPAHLREGTAKDNSDDAVARKRAVFPKPPTQAGERNNGAKLTAEQAREIFESTDGVAVLVVRHDVSNRTIRDIRARRTWQSVNPI